MTKSFLYNCYLFLWVKMPSWFYCLLSGLSFDSSWSVKGRIRVIKRKWYDRLFRGIRGGAIQIGKDFKCNNKICSNSLGLIQPCVFNISEVDSKIVIGNNVGISGSTLNARIKIVIEDNVLVGSGCLITDTDSHPLEYSSRLTDNKEMIKSSPILIKEGAFIGARSIILKGVTIGAHSIVGAGSVVSSSIPDNCIACGNPARVIKVIG